MSYNLKNYFKYSIYSQTNGCGRKKRKQAKLLHTGFFFSLRHFGHLCEIAQMSFSSLIFGIFFVTEKGICTELTYFFGHFKKNSVNHHKTTERNPSSTDAFNDVEAGPALADFGAQCKTWAQGPMQDLSGPSEQWFYGFIVFSQPCYDRGRAQICSTALTRKLSTFANVWEEIC